MAFLSHSLSPPLLSQVSGAGMLLITIAISELIHSLLPPALTLLSPSTTWKSSHLPLPVILEFQTLLFPNMAGMGAPVCTFGQQQNPIPVIASVDTIPRCHRCQRHHCKLWKVSL